MKRRPNWKVEFIPHEFRIPGTLLLASAGTALFFFTKGPSNPPDQVDRTTRPRPRLAPAFWTTAHAPDPGHDLPITAIRPEDLGVFPPTSPTDHPSRIRELITSGDESALQSAITAWFEADPQATRDWLASQPTLEDLQPALAGISNRIAESGNSPQALQWAALLAPGDAREATLFNIYALGSRQHQFTESELRQAPLPPDRIAELLSGAAGD